MMQAKLKTLVTSFATESGRSYGFPDVSGFREDVGGLDAYLKCAGVKYFSGKEMATPYHPEIAQRLGWEDGLLIPSQDRWAWGLACAAIAEQVRRKIGEPLLIANWYRPEPYNAAVGGAPGGDHPAAAAVDLQLLSRGSTAQSKARAKALTYLLDLYRKTDYMALGAYSDPRRIHVGVYTPAGRRRWGL